MKGVLIGIAIGFGLLVTHDADAAPWCDHVAGGSEAQAVQEASAAVDAGCPCDSFSRPGHYRSCLQNVLQDRVRAGLLSKVCARTVKSIILPNTCGYPDDAVACVRFKSRSTPGRRGCRIVRDVSRCKPPAGGGACTSDASCYAATINSYSEGPGCIGG